MGATPIGAPIAGWVADAFGPRAAIMVGGAAGLVSFAIGAGWMLHSGRLHRREDARFLLTLDETRPVRVVEAMQRAFIPPITSATTPIRVEPRTGTAPGSERLDGTGSAGTGFARTGSGDVGLDAPCADLDASRADATKRDGSGDGA